MHVIEVYCSFSSNFFPTHPTISSKLYVFFLSSIIMTSLSATSMCMDIGPSTGMYVASQGSQPFKNLTVPSLSSHQLPATPQVGWNFVITSLPIYAGYMVTWLRSWAYSHCIHACIYLIASRKQCVVVVTHCLQLLQSLCFLSLWGSKEVLYGQSPFRAQHSSLSFSLHADHVVVLCVNHHQLPKASVQELSDALIYG